MKLNAHNISFGFRYSIGFSGWKRPDSRIAGDSRIGPQVDGPIRARLPGQPISHPLETHKTCT